MISAENQVISSLPRQEGEERVKYIFSVEDIEESDATTDLVQLFQLCHDIAVSRGWWHHYDGSSKFRNFGEAIALIHSEISEALEGQRKRLVSDHIPEFSMFEEEMADTIIRIGDLVTGMGPEVARNVVKAISAKLWFNLNRQDHSPEARAAEGGKGF